MDLNTLLWIEDNKPYLASPHISGIDLKYVNKYLLTNIPQKKWFLSQSEINTVHGLRHTIRVMIYAIILGKQKRLLPPEIRNVTIAAAIHDLRRINDKKDYGHSDRAYQWFLNNKDKIYKKRLSNISPRDSESIGSAIFFHDEDYKHIKKNSRYLRSSKIVDILKTADALDRYRLPKVKWWINDRRLSLKPSDSIKNFAFKLIIASEHRFLLSGNNIKSVVEALNNIFHEIK